MSTTSGTSGVNVNELFKTEAPAPEKPKPKPKSVRATPEFEQRVKLAIATTPGGVRQLQVRGEKAEQIKAAVASGDLVSVQMKVTSGQIGAERGVAIRASDTQENAKEGFIFEYNPHNGHTFYGPVNLPQTIMQVPG